jgi:gas vesicle protein
VAERTTELRNEIDDTRDHLGDTLDAIGDRVSPGRIVERRKNRARHSLDTVRERVMGAAPAKPSTAGVRESASNAVASVGDGVRNAPDAVASSTQGNPLVTGAIAFGAGVLVASLLPTSEAEASVADSVVEPLKAEATDIGKEIGSTAKQSASQAGEETKAALSDAAATVKDEASSRAQDVKQSATDAADQVKSTAQDSKDKVAGQA